MKSRYLSSTLLFLVTFFVFTQSSYAYIDAGTGSYAIQFLLAGLFGGLFILKTFWSKIKAFFTSFRKKKSK